MKGNIKNWKWWVATPFALLLLFVALIPVAVIALLNTALAAVELVNFGKKPSKLASAMNNWVHK